MSPEPQIQPQITEAMALIASVPGYASVAERLTRRTIRFVPTLIDRGEARLSGVILIGPEALLGSTIGLAETLVHEEFHTRQNPLLKTHSFWSGIFTKTPVMARYERPAYQAALDFLSALAVAHPQLTAEASAEAEAIRASFLTNYQSAI
jgi:hypothetical protein